MEDGEENLNKKLVAVEVGWAACAEGVGRFFKFSWSQER